MDTVSLETIIKSLKNADFTHDNLLDINDVLKEKNAFF